MFEGQNPGNSDSLTVDAAATVFEGLLSPEKKRPAKTEVPEPEVEVEEEPTDSEEIEPTEEEDEEPDDESSEEEPESAEDEETTEDGEEEDGEPTPKPRLHKIKVNGEEIEVEEEELHRGYSRTADYTQKTQQLAADRKAFESETVAVRAERQKYATALTQLTDALAEMKPAEPDWTALRRDNPDQYAATWAAWQQHEQETAEVEAERNAIMAKLAEDQQNEFRASLASEREKLVEAIPEWKDDTKATAEKAEIAAYAKKLGYTDADLASVTDHKAMVVIRKAMLYDAAQAKAKIVKPIVKRRIEAVKVTVPGSTKTKPKTTVATKARERLARTGRVTDAAASILTMLSDEDV